MLMKGLDSRAGTAALSNPARFLDHRRGVAKTLGRGSGSYPLFGRELPGYPYQRNPTVIGMTIVLPSLW
jgi:hypothetical protein